MATVNIYLAFNGNCEEAFNFYKSVFGGEFSYIGKYKDMPSSEPVKDEDKEKVMHVGLPISKETILMGCDTCSQSGACVTGNNFSIAILPENEDEARRLFDALAVGGNVTMPLNKTFWESLFGMLTDKFGINWMVEFSLKQDGCSA